MSEILKEEQWQRRRAAKLQRVSQPRARQDARPLLPEKPADVAPKAKVPKRASGPGGADRIRDAAEPTGTDATPHPETVSLIDRKRPAKNLRTAR